MNQPFLAAVALALASTALPLAAQTCGSDCYGAYQQPSFGHECKQDYLQNAMWPSQYIAPARRSVYAPFATMVQNGWRRQNLIGTRYFDKETGNLTEAGQLKTHWVLTQAPISRRQLFIEQDYDAEKMGHQTESLRDFAGLVDPTAEEVAITPIPIRDRGRPAAIVDHNFTGFQENQPIPALPQGRTTGSTSN